MKPEITVNDILFSILRAEICGVEADKDIIKLISEDLLKELYLIATSHDVVHMVAMWLLKSGVTMSSGAQEYFMSTLALAIRRYDQMSKDYERICKTLEEEKVPYIPLKGAVIRDFYPEPWMRTSCDIDILVKEDDLERAVAVLSKKMSFKSEGNRNYHDISLFSPDNTHLELHFNIKENMENLDAVLEDVWNYAEPEEGNKYNLKKEFFIFQIFAHIAYHFTSGGCGIKSLMDIWILEHKMDAHYTVARQLLEKAGIYKFAEEMSRLANKCFSGEPRDDFSDKVLGYIFKGGVYGSVQNKMVIQKNKSGNSVAYTIKKLFLPYRSMTVLYPVLKQAPYLLPFCWVARWIKGLFGGKAKVIAKEIAYINDVSENEAADIKEIHSKLGLEFK